MRKAIGPVLLAAAMLTTTSYFTNASASTVTFGPTGWVYNDAASVPWVVAIDDLTANQYRVKISIFDAQIGDVFGFGFDSDLTGLTLASLTQVSSFTGDTITGLYGDGTNSQDDCGPGCKFDGISENFDYIVRLGVSGAASGWNTTWEFLIAHPAASLLSSFTQVGIRAQSIGPNGLSAKDYNNTGEYCEGLCSTPVGEVPIPAALPLLAAGLSAMGFMGWRRKRKAPTA